MGGPKRIILVIVLVLLVLAAVLSIWFVSLKPEVREIILGNLLGMQG